MLSFVLSKFVKILQEGLKEVGKENIISQRPDFTKRITLPLVAVYDSEFEFEEVGLGGGLGETKEEKNDEFSGDGKKNSFILSDKPIRPILSVESPKGTDMKEARDYRVDYATGTVLFSTPPPSGSKNVLVRYMIAAGEVRGLRLKIKCNVDLWAKDVTQSDSLTTETIKALLLAREDFSSNGINLTPLKGVGLGNEGAPKDAFGRRLIYLAETDLKVEKPSGRIEKIEIRELGEQK